MIPHALAGYLVNAAWQAPLVALCALILTRFGGFSPGGRNRLWLGFLAVAVILPAVALGDILPHALPVVARTPPAAPILAPILAPLAPAESLATLPTEPPATAAAPAMVLAPWSAWLMVGLLAVVAGLLLVRLVVAARAARRLVAESRPVALPASVIQALEALARHHDRTVPPVRRSRAVRSPAVVGALRPTILIPDGLDATDDDLRAALLHELAHVLRHDYAVNLACELLTLPVAWHPATLALKAGVRHSRELACDAMAAAAMTSQKTYARCLVSLAQTLGAGASAPSTQAALAVGLFGRGGLEDRLMQLMKPRDDEAPAVRAARLCGLAALGAGLLGSAALLHVTPVFAQAPAPARASPARAPVAPSTPAAAVAAQAAADAGKSATPVHRRHGLIYSKKGVLIEVGDQGYRHSFTAANGKTITVTNDDPAEPSAQQQREWEAEARAAEEQAEKAEAMVNSPEFKARIERAKAAGEAARRMTESPEFKARIAKLTADAAKAAAVVDSPAFKAHIARIKADGEAIGKLMDRPEYRARMEAARASGEAARAMAESAEFKAQMAQMREDAAGMRRDMAAFREQQRAGPGPTP